MSLIKWRESYNTGVERFDQEHRQVVEAINTMYELLKQGVEKEKMQSVIEALEQYAGAHFDAEEEAMKDASFPGLAEHVAEHEKLKKEVGEYRRRFDQGEENVEQELYRFLRGWLMNHIVEVDKKYGSHLA